jgi:2-methylcitrate dehydratase PrpD
MARSLRFSLFDWAAVAIAGADEPVSRAARKLAQAEGPGTATLVGGGTVHPRAAALANGATSHALDYDDTHFLHVGHPSVAVVPAALAVAQSTGASGRDLIAALAVGLEVSCRIGDWLGRAHYSAGFHQTGTAGAFGAAAAAGRLMGLDADGMQAALALTATRAAGLKSQFGTMGKPLNAGFAAETGVTCALLAAAGATSSDTAIEGAQGFGPTHAGQARAKAMDGLGTAWVFPGVSYKFHACCHGLHAMLEALATLKAEVDAGLIETVTVTINPRWLDTAALAS